MSESIEIEAKVQDKNNSNFQIKKKAVIKHKFLFLTWMTLIEINKKNFLKFIENKLETSVLIQFQDIKNLLQFVLITDEDQDFLLKNLDTLDQGGVEVEEIKQWYKELVTFRLRIPMSHFLLIIFEEWKERYNKQVQVLQTALAAELATPVTLNQVISITIQMRPELESQHLVDLYLNSLDIESQTFQVLEYSQQLSKLLPPLMPFQKRKKRPRSPKKK